MDTSGTSMTARVTTISWNQSRRRPGDSRRQRGLRLLQNARRYLLGEILSTRPRDLDPIDATHEQEACPWPHPWPSKGEGPDTKGTRSPIPRQQLAEVLVYLFLIVPSMVLSFFVLRQGNVGFVFVAVATILRDLSLVSLVLFFTWRNGEPLRRIGWTASRAWREIILGLALFLPFSLGVGLLGRMLEAAGLTAPSTPLPAFIAARGPTELVLAAVLVAVVAFAEETIFRGYLILRLQSITGSRTAAVILSSLIFSLGHGYEGSAGVVTVGCMGLTLALIYLGRQSLVAPTVIHFLQDFLGIVLLPLLGMH
jgi:membrane protease YdiL (CAAX protease family)